MQNSSRTSFNDYTYAELRPVRGNAPHTNVVHHTNLSVDAPEFVPRRISSMRMAVPHQQQQSYQSYQQSSPQMQHHHHHNHQMNHTNQKRNNRFSVQDRLNVTSGFNSDSHHSHSQHHHNVASGGASGGGGTSYNQQNRHQNNANSDQSGASDAGSHALNLLLEVMRKLNDDPGLFETHQKELNTVYLEFAQSEFVMSNAIEIIFDQSINEPNFRYMGARICRLLDALEPSPNSVFRNLLCLKMNYNQNENLTFITNDAHKVRGTTLFLAELYMQLQNDGSRIGEVAKSIYEAIHLLLQKKTPENIKCVCQTLKLCGYELEIDFPSEAANVLSILRDVRDIDVSTERLLKSVLDLSQNRWGRTEAVLSPSIIENNIQQDFSNEPVFYGPDGKILTEEESSFLSGIPNFEYYDDNDPDELVEPDPEMDLEIQLAFKDFVKIGQQK